MNKIVRTTLVIGAVAGVAALMAGVWYWLHSGTDPAVPSVNTPAGAHGGAGSLGGYADVWSAKGPANAMPPGPASAGPTPQNKTEANMIAARDLRAKAQNDPAVLQDLIQRYGSEHDPQARAMLKAVLATIDKPEVVALAKRLVVDTDAGKRKEGLELLQVMPGNSPDVRNAIRQVLTTEQSPAVLALALAALKPAAVEPGEARAIIADLERFTRNADAAVRRQSVFQLGLWARNGEAVDRLSEALLDQSPEVKQAAIFALAQSNVRPDSIKTALLGIMNNPGESRQTRDSALQALDRFQLTAEEEVAYRQVRSQIHGY